LARGTLHHSGDNHDLFVYDTAEIVGWSEHDARALAIVRFTGSGKGSGAPMDAQFAHLLDFRGDRIVRLRWFHDEDAGRAALTSPH
jgi:ketosteroid isomerase-like protein